MSTQAKTFIAPHLVCAGAAEAIEFYKKAFGATEEMRMAGPDGKGIMHACIKIDGAPIFLVDENPQWGALSPRTLNGSPVTIHLQVADADALFERAVKAGATVKMPLADMFWGDRYGVLVDPSGHNWSIATHLRDMTQAEIKEEMMKAFGGQKG
jgi:PhnB protein